MKKNAKKFLSDKINVTKNAPFFLLRAPTHNSFTFISGPHMSCAQSFSKAATGGLL